MKPLQPNQTTVVHALIRKSLELDQNTAHHKTLTAERNQAIIDALATELPLRYVAQHAGLSFQYIDRIRHQTPIRQPEATTPTTDPDKPGPHENDALAA
jgi:hypothetical protein